MRPYPEIIFRINKGGMDEGVADTRTIRPIKLIGNIIDTIIFIQSQPVCSHPNKSLFILGDGGYRTLGSTIF